MHTSFNAYEGFLILLFAALFSPGSSNQRYNLIVVDPPWENGCVRQKEA